MNYFKSLILINLFISILGNVVKADYLGIEIIHYTRHFSNKSIELGEKYPRKLDAKGVHIITPGIEVYFDNEYCYWIEAYTNDGVVSNPSPIVCDEINYFGMVVC